MSLEDAVQAVLNANLQAKTAQAEITANGGAGVLDPESWDVRAVATWNFWEWGCTIKGVREQERRLAQTKNDFQRIRDNVRLEVKQANLKVVESQKNIHTVETAIEQARENYRILDERYQLQAATSVEVLDGRTLLTRTRVNDYSALYDFKTAKAALDLAMVKDTAPEAPPSKK
jgi:outer membrane protein TolC